MANSASSSPQRGVSLRKTNKPLMEKRRRARINDSLTQLKSLVIQSSKKDSSQFNKLEKADILELTVKHLRSLQDQQQQQSQVSDSGTAEKYHAGFMECANEVIRYIGQSQGFSDSIKTRVIHHLASCLQLSSKPSFTKPAQTNSATPEATSTVANGLQTMNAQLANGQIIQIVSSQFQNIKPSGVSQFTGSQPIPIAPATSSLPVSSASTYIPVAMDPASISSTAKSSNVRYTQPLHIQIPQVLSPVIIQSKPSQLQMQLQTQVVYKIQDTVPQILCKSQQETLVSSSTPSPQPTDVTMPSPALTTNQKSHYHYSHDDQYSDFMPRSRTYSLVSPVSSESELTSPLNLSQSPRYCDRDINNYHPSPLSSNYSQNSLSDKSSYTNNFSRSSWLPSQYSSSDFKSVIVDGRKAADTHAIKYMPIMDEDRMCFRHDGTSSPASSVGEDRLWRPW